MEPRWATVACVSEDGGLYVCDVLHTIECVYFNPVLTQVQIENL